MVQVEPAPVTLTQDSREVRFFQQLYSTMLMDFHSGQAFEWTYVPAPLLEWDEPHLDWIFNATGMQKLVELPSLSALPAAIVAILEIPDAPDQESDEFGSLLATRLDGLLATNLMAWGMRWTPRL